MKTGITLLAATLATIAAVPTAFAGATGASACGLMAPAVARLRVDIDAALAAARLAQSAAQPQNVVTSGLIIGPLDHARAATNVALPFAVVGTPAAAAQVHGVSFATIAVQLAHAQHWATVFRIHEGKPGLAALSRQIGDLRKADLELDHLASECYMSL